MNLLDYSFTNKLKRSEILIVKLDGETGKTIPAAGTGFEILDSGGNRIELTDSDGNKVSVFTPTKPEKSSFLKSLHTARTSWSKQKRRKGMF